MKALHKYILTAAVAFIATGAGAQMKTSYFMEGSIPRYDMNAALTPMHGYVNLPLLPLGAFGINLNNNFAAVDNFIYPHNGGHVLFFHESVDPKKFLSRIPNRSTLNLDLNYNLLGFGNYSKKHNYFWSFGWNIRAIADVGIPKELFSIMKDLKNGIYDIPDVTIGATAYSEFAFGFTMPVWESLVVGGRLKFLVGLAQAEAALNNINIEATNTNVKASLGGTMRASVFGLNFDHLQSNADGSIDLDDIFDFGGLSMANGFKSYGAAIDIGAEMKFLDDRLKASFALNDLGFIKWSGTNSVHADMDEIAFEFNGINLDTGEAEIVEPEEIGVFRKTDSTKGYSKRLSTTMNIGVEYNFFDNLLGVGLLSHTKFSNRVTYSELTLAGTVRPGDWFTASLSHSLVNNKFGIFGLALNFHPRGVNFFLGFDYIPMQMAKIDNVMVPLRMKSFNTYIGLAFTPGGRSKPWGGKPAEVEYCD